MTFEYGASKHRAQHNMEAARNPYLQHILAGLNGTVASDYFTASDALSSVTPRSSREVESTQQAEPSPPVQAPAIAPKLNPTVADASSIVTWPAGVRHVARHITTSEAASTRIKHLIASQHKHEREWWTARTAIVKRQSNRTATQAKAADLLKSIGGLVNEQSSDSNDPEVARKELAEFDRKVHSGLVKMVADFDRILRRLGVPFFAIKHELVMNSDKALSTSAQRGSGKLTKPELIELQKKMLLHLEDLFMD